MVVSIVTMNAQGVTDLLKLSDNTIMGTARYMGMAGSFGALGGDASSIIDNPAGLAVYRSSEATFTLSPTITNTVSKSSTSVAKENSFYFNFSNAAVVVAIPTYKDKGLVSANLSFSYNRLKDFNRKFGYRNTSSMPSLTSEIANMTYGFSESQISPDNYYVPYLSDIAYNSYAINPLADSVSWSPMGGKSSESAFLGVENGRIDEYNFAYGMNFSHRVYVGVSLGVQSLYYSMTSESAERYTGNQYMTLENSFSTSGIGVNFGAGVIVRANSFLRLAASIHTPTYYTKVEDYYVGAMNTNGSPTAPKDYVSFEGEASGLYYAYATPLKFMASAAFVLGKNGLINLEYQLTDYQSTMRYDEENNSGDYLFDAADYSFENAGIDKYAKIAHTAKIGAEYRIASKVSFRAGFAYVSPAVSENVVRTLLSNTTRTDLDYYYDKGSFYGSVGIGYRYNGFGVELAYLYRN